MRSKSLKVVAAVLAFAVVVGLLIWAFVEGRKEVAQEQERERPIKAPQRVAIEEGETVIKLDQATQKKSGIGVAPLKAVSHQEELRAYGTVMDLQPLGDLRNSFATARAQVEKTRASLEASRKEYERLKPLQDSQNISTKVFQAAEAISRSDEASAGAARTALSVLEGTISQRWGGVLAKWLFDGSKEFDRLMQRQDVLLQITLPPGSRFSSAPRNARVQAPEGKIAAASLVSPSPSTDPRIQGISLFYLAQAQATDLLPGMNVLAFLPNGSQNRGVVVPAAAVVWWQGKAWIYAQKDSDRFIRREITTETPVEDGWFVGKGLSPNDRIVTSGAQLLLSEELRSQIQVGG
jgi:hypothetical protein